MMNEKRRKVVIAALSAIVIMGLFPPWASTFTYMSADSKRPAGYAFVLTPPTPQQDRPAYGVVIDVPRLIVQWSVVLGITGLGWLLFRD